MDCGFWCGLCDISCPYASPRAWPLDKSLPAHIPQARRQSLACKLLSAQISFPKQDQRLVSQILILPTEVFSVSISLRTSRNFSL